MLTAQFVKSLASKWEHHSVGFNDPLSKAWELSTDCTPELIVLQETRLCCSFLFLQLPFPYRSDLHRVENRGKTFPLKRNPVILGVRSNFTWDISPLLGAWEEGFKSNTWESVTCSFPTPYMGISACPQFPPKYSNLAPWLSIIPLPHTSTACLCCLQGWSDFTSSMQTPGLS